LQLNGYLAFPFVGQTLLYNATRSEKSGKKTKEIAYGLASESPANTSAERVLIFNR
jgi:hypothetical protein